MISKVFMICDAYESGYGHGLQRDGLDGSKTPFGNPEHAEAYQLGYDAGLKRASTQQPTASKPEVLATIDIKNGKIYGWKFYIRADIPDGTHALIRADAAPADVRDKALEQRLGAYVLDFAKRIGWTNDGEGAFEYIQRKSYAQGVEDASVRHRHADVPAQTWSDADLLSLAVECGFEDDCIDMMESDFLDFARRLLEGKK